MLIAPDALTPDQLQRMRERQNGLEPLNERTIEEVLDGWREKLRRLAKESEGYLVFGHDG